MIFLLTILNQILIVDFILFLLVYGLCIVVLSLCHEIVVERPIMLHCHFSRVAIFVD